METRDELISEMTHPYTEAEMDYALVICEELYDRIAEVAAREMSIRCEEQAEVIKQIAGGHCDICDFEASCFRAYGDILREKCAEGVATYIEARVKERMEG